MSEPSESGNTVAESHPTIRPTVIQIFVLLIVGAALIIFLRRNPELLGERQITEVANLVIGILVTLGVIRLGIRAFVYTRTTYEVTEKRVKKKYELLYRREEKEVPFDLVRSHEFSQDRIETLLGYGTVKLNQGLGTLKLANIEHPHEFNQAIRTRLE